MKDYAKMRRNMVDGQLRPNGLTDQALITQFLAVPRENFLEGDLRQSAYADDDIKLPNGGFLMEPMVLARLLIAAAVQAGDTVLNIGDTTGYSAALLTGLGAQVTTVAAIAEAEAGSYRAIIVNGAVAAIPESLLSLLAHGGRLVAVLRPATAQTGVITVVERDGAGVYSHDTREDAAIPYLPGQAPVAGFKF